MSNGAVAARDGQEMPIRGYGSAEGVAGARDCERSLLLPAHRAMNLLHSLGRNTKAPTAAALRLVMSTPPAAASFATRIR